MSVSTTLSSSCLWALLVVGCTHPQSGELKMAATRGEDPEDPGDGSWRTEGDCQYRTTITGNGSRVVTIRGLDGGECPAYEGLLPAGNAGDLPLAP